MTEIDKVIQLFLEYFKQKLRSYKGRTDIENNVSYKLKVNNNIYEIVVSLPGYYKFVEYGVNGYLNNVGSDYSFKDDGRIIPVNKLEEWITVKGIPLPTMPRQLNVKQYAYALAHSIKRKGIKPTPALKESVESFGFKDRLMKAISADMKQKIIDSLNEEIKLKKLG